MSDSEEDDRLYVETGRVPATLENFLKNLGEEKYEVLKKMQLGPMVSSVMYNTLNLEVDEDAWAVLTEQLVAEGFFSTKTLFFLTRLKILQMILKAPLCMRRKILNDFYGIRNMPDVRDQEIQ